MSTISVRCSALPLAMACPGSVRDDGLRVDPANDASGVGSAAHEALRAVAETGSADWDRIPEIAANHGADEEEVRMLVAQGTKLWQTVRGDFPHPMTEVPMSVDLTPNFTLHGHADVISVSGRTGRVWDWKTGRVDRSYREQFLGYAALLLLDNPDLDLVTASGGWVRSCEAEHYTLRRADLKRWTARILETVATWRGTYSPGSHCAHCPRAHDCPAARALVRRDVAVFQGADGPLDVSALTPEQKIDILAQSKRVAEMAERVQAAVKEWVATNGEVAANGSVLSLESRETRALDPLKAWQVLTDAGFEDADFAASMDLRIGRVEKRVAEKAGRGKGAAAVRDLSEKLEAAGAVSRRETKTLTLRRQ